MCSQFYILFLFLFSHHLSWALVFDSKTEVYIAGNSYSVDSEFAEKNQVLYFLSSDNKIKLNSKYEFALSPEIDFRR